MAYCYLIALGSNLGDRETYIADAMVKIAQEIGPIKRQSRLYETAPIGNADQQFLNGALICESSLEPAACMRALLSIESALGRERSIHWGNRTIDLDIVMIKDAQRQSMALASPELVVPHPRAHLRRFVCEPCAEIAPHWRLGEPPRTFAEWLETM